MYRYIPYLFLNKKGYRSIGLSAHDIMKNNKCTIQNISKVLTLANIYIYRQKDKKINRCF